MWPEWHPYRAIALFSATAVILFLPKVAAILVALRRDGRYLVSVTPPGPGAAYLVIDPQQHSLDAGMLADDGWTFKRTAAAEMALPAAVRALTGR